MSTNTIKLGAVIAAMALALAATHFSLQSWSVGSLGEWVSGSGAFVAAVAALWIAERQRLDAAAAEDRRAELQRRADMNADAVLVQIAIEALGRSLKVFSTAVNGVDLTKREKRQHLQWMLRTKILEGMALTARSIAVHAAHHPGTVTTLINLRAALEGLPVKIEVIAGGGEDSAALRAASLKLEMKKLDEAMRWRWRLSEDLLEGPLPEETVKQLRLLRKIYFS